MRFLRTLIIIIIIKIKAKTLGSHMKMSEFLGFYSS